MQRHLKSTTGFRRALAVGRALIVLLLCTGSALAATFKTSLDRQSIVLGEQVTLTLTFEGARPQQISNLPAIEGLHVASAVSQGINSSVGPQGAVTVYTYSFALEPQRSGEFVIPPFHATVDGQTLSSLPLRLQVSGEDKVQPPATLATQPAFLWLSLPKNELYLGETAIGELRLYVRNDAQRIGNLQLPLSGDGFTFSKLVDGPRFHRRVGNSAFTVFSFQFAFTPLKTGSLAVGPIAGSVVLNPPGMMDFDSFFNRSRAQQVPLNFAASSVQVQPLPREGMPVNFSGAVGRFNMAVTAGPTNVAAGDPITVRVQISGQGHLESINLPEQPEWDAFKIYPPTSQIETSDPFGIQGTKTFEQVIIPQSADIQQIPPIGFSYFDVEQKAYKTVQQAAIPLSVRPGGSTPLPSIVSPAGRKDTEVANQDIVPIKQRPGVLAPPSPALIRQPVFLALQGIPVCALIGAVLLRRRREALANNPRLVRQRHVAQLVREGLDELRTHAGANNSDAFFATVFRLLQEQLGERLDAPASSITEAVIDERLRPNGVPESTLHPLQELFHACNLARYAPIKSSQELAAFIPRVESTLAQIREVNA